MAHAPRAVDFSRELEADRLLQIHQVLRNIRRAVSCSKWTTDTVGWRKGIDRSFDWAETRSDCAEVHVFNGPLLID